MWTVLTYVYNSILIIFIAAHLLVGAIISFLTGLYMGIYICQTYEIPRITEPSKIWERLVQFMEKYRRTPHTSLSSKLSLFHPKSVISIIKADYDIDKNQKVSAAEITRRQEVQEESEEFKSQSPTLILTDPQFEESDSSSGIVRRPSSSQILEASLVINNTLDEPTPYEYPSIPYERRF